MQQLLDVIKDSKDDHSISQVSAREDLRYPRDVILVRISGSQPLGERIVSFDRGTHVGAVRIAGGCSGF